MLESDDMALLRNSWTDWIAAGEGLSDDEWESVEVLPGWSASIMFGHICLGVDVMGTMSPAGGRRGVNYLYYFRGVGKIPDGPRYVTELARKSASRGNREALLARILQGVRTLDDLESAEWCVQTVMGEMLITEFALTRLIESVVHLRDLGRAFGHGRIAGPHPDAVDRVAVLLMNLVGKESFIDACCGRTRLWQVIR